MASWKIDWAEIETPFPIASAAFQIKSESEIPKETELKYRYQQMTSWKIDWAQIETPFPVF